MWHNDFPLVGSVTLINRNIKLGHNVCIYPGVMYWGDGLIEIGDNVDIGKDTVIYASKSGGVKIGNGTVIAAQCYIIDANHGFKGRVPIRGQINDVKAVSIGEECWLGANVTVIKGSQIGDGAVIGAKALVNCEIPPFAVAVGVPCKVIKYR